MHKRQHKIFVIAIVISSLVILTGCPGRQHEADISGIKIDDVKIHRYDSILFELPIDSIAEGLKEISQEYWIFIGEGYKDSLNVQQIKDFITDPFILEIQDACWTKFKDLTWLSNDLQTTFRYVKYYLPDSKLPTVYSYISGLIYELPVNYLDSVMLIAIDMYLGQEFKGYRQIGIPVYLTKRMERPYLLPDVAKQIAISEIPVEIQLNTLLDNMIQHGKILYFSDLVLPEADDTLKIGYTQQQMQWAKDNEANTWAFLIEKELLYTSAYFEINKFIQDGPFTNGFPKESPAMLGRWIGWQIVREYMDNNSDVTLPELLQERDSQKILSRSRYKPRG